MKCRYRDIDILILLTGSGRAVELVLEDGDTGVGGPASGGWVPALPRANLNTGRLGRILSETEDTIVARKDLVMTTLCAPCPPCRDTRGPGPPRDHCAGNPSLCRCRSLAMSR